jgi:putative flippase GtrA
MGLSSLRLLAYAGDEEMRKRLRYLGVSVVFVPIGQGLIQVLGIWLDDYTAASLLQGAIVALPLFFANKRFVWRISSGENLRNQLLVFSVTLMLCLSLTTVLTYLAECSVAGQSTLVRGTVVFFAQLLGLAIAFISRFLVLDRWLFKVSAETPEDDDAVSDEIPAP